MVVADVLLMLLPERGIANELPVSLSTKRGKVDDANPGVDRVAHSQSLWSVWCFRFINSEPERTEVDDFCQKEKK